ncbi:MAG: hypothetical protein LAO19_17980 [Acidobacteriia bacterium]|nr:hypothetical protein [Terriglobia bacterium]
MFNAFHRCIPNAVLEYIAHLRLSSFAADQLYCELNSSDQCIFQLHFGNVSMWASLRADLALKTAARPDVRLHLADGPRVRRCTESILLFRNVPRNGRHILALRAKICRYFLASGVVQWSALVREKISSLKFRKRNGTAFQH